MARPDVCFYFLRRSTGAGHERHEALSGVDGEMDRAQTVSGTGPQRPLQRRDARAHLHLVCIHLALVLVQLETTRRARAHISSRGNRLGLAADLCWIFRDPCALGSDARLAAQLSVSGSALAAVALHTDGSEHRLGRYLDRNNVAPECSAARHRLQGFLKHTGLALTLETRHLPGLEYDCAAAASVLR